MARTEKPRICPVCGHPKYLQWFTPSDSRLGTEAIECDKCGAASIQVSENKSIYNWNRGIDICKKTKHANGSYYYMPTETYHTEINRPMSNYR